MIQIGWRAGGRFGVVSGTVAAAGGTYTVAALGHTVGVEPVWALLAGSAGAFAALLVAAWRALPGEQLVFRGGCWLAAGLWCWWAVASTPWSRTTALTLGVAALVAGLLAGGYRHQRQRTLAADAGGVRDEGGGQQQRWERRLARIAQVGRISADGQLVGGAQVVKIDRWPTGAGYTVNVRLSGGKTWRHVDAYADELASDLRLPRGCGVEVGEGPDRGSCTIGVATSDTLAEEQPYPDDLPVRSVHDPIRLGLRRDATPARIEMRQPSTGVFGQKGQGKTNLLHVVIAELLCCVDTLVWVIDLGGGGVALPWLDHHDTEGTPVIDWVADTPAKARAMLEAALKIARHRKITYAARKRAQNVDLMPVDATVPEIVIILDEGAEVTGFRQAGGGSADLKTLPGLLASVVQIARDSAVNVVYSGLRATGDVLGRDIFSQLGNRVALRMADEAELAYAMGWGRGMSLEDIPHPGCGFVTSVDEKNSRPFRAYRLLPAQIEQIAAAVAGRRPELDAPSRLVAGEAYETRWDTPPGAGGAPAEHATGGQDREPLPSVSPADALQAAAEARRRLEAAVAADSGVADSQPDTESDDVDSQFEEIMAAAWQEPAAPATDTAARGRARVLELVDLAGPAGVRAGALHAQLTRDGVAVSRSTLYTWLGQEKAAGRIVQPGGDKSPYLVPRFSGGMGRR